MAKKLCSYIINGNPVGTELDSWMESDLNGNPPFKLSDVVESGYSDITSIENLDNFGLSLHPDYQELRKAIQLAGYQKGWTNCTNSEKDLLIKYHAHPDKGLGNQDTEKIMYLLSLGMSLTEAKQFLVLSWFNHWNLFMDDCLMRWRNVGFTAIAYLTIADGTNLNNTVESLRSSYLDSGVVGKMYGDSRDGLMDYVWSVNGFLDQGLEENGYVLQQGTWYDFKKDIEKELVSKYYWDDIQPYWDALI